MEKKDFHIHSTFSDGKNTPEEIVVFAIENGFNKIGFSDHSTTIFDKSYCCQDEEKYKKEIERLKIKYKEKIEILCGIEQDFFSGKASGYDYVIGSVHYVKAKGEYIPVDLSFEVLKNAIDKYFNGEAFGFIKEYYKLVSKVIKQTNADIIGHFDLVSKFNEKTPFFDESDNKYIKCWKKAVDKLIKYNKPFEINTGVISRGYKSKPYPAQEIINYIKEKGGKFILSSDSHKKETLGYLFDECNI